MVLIVAFYFIVFKSSKFEKNYLCKVYCPAICYSKAITIKIRIEIIWVSYLL